MSNWYKKLAQQKPRVSMIVAYDDNRTIGKGGKMPWHIPEDLKLFRQTTSGNVVVMGHTTWSAVGGKPLPNRVNIIVSRSGAAEAPPGNPVTLNSIPAAIDHAAKNYPGKEVFIIGGSQMYREALKSGVVDRVLASEIKGNVLPDGDVFFPKLDEGFEEKSRTPYADASKPFDAVEYGRRQQQPAA